MKIYLFICTRHREFGIFNFLRYLRLPTALQGILFWKKWFFHEIFQVGACPNLKDSSLYDRFSIHMYKVEAFGFFLVFRYLRLSYALYGIFFWKKMIFHEIFQVGACPNLKDSLSYDRFSIHMYNAWSIRYFQHFSSIRFLTKVFFMKYFKLVHAPTWKIAHYMTGFLSICTRHEAFGFFDCFALSVTPLCFVRYICWKRMTVHDIFQVGAILTWKIPRYMIGFLFKWTRHEAFGIFNIFPLSATPLCLVRFICF